MIILSENQIKALRAIKRARLLTYKAVASYDQRTLRSLWVRGLVVVATKGLAVSGKGQAALRVYSSAAARLRKDPTKPKFWDWQGSEKWTR